jgi:hypothetical protein
VPATSAIVQEEAPAILLLAIGLIALAVVGGRSKRALHARPPG